MDNRQFIIAECLRKASAVLPQEEARGLKPWSVHSARFGMDSRPSYASH